MMVKIVKFLCRLMKLKNGVILKTMVLVMEEMQGWHRSQRIVSKKRFGGQCWWIKLIL